MAGAEVLGGFIFPGEDFTRYQLAFHIQFDHLRCRLGEDRLVRYWKFNAPYKVSKADQQRVEMWHAGYRAALVTLQAPEYK